MATNLSTLDAPGPTVARPNRPYCPALTVLAHPDPSRVGMRALAPALAAGGSIAISRLEPFFAEPSSGTQARAAEGSPLAEPHLSRSPIHIVRLGDGRLRIDRHGTSLRVVVDGTPLETSLDLDAAALARGVVLELVERIVLLLHEVDQACHPEPDHGLGLVGESTAIWCLRREIRRLADLDITTLIVGETGVGKELVARAIHVAGRPNRPFIAVNMGGIPQALAGAELFGSERGAYTGAWHSRRGHFGEAEHGTIFLDEIGETPLDVQALLLRALDEGEVQVVGASRPHRVRVRVLAATDVDLEQRVRTGAFRAPLLHRLASFTLTVPPLRERKDDIGRLLRHFLRTEETRIGGGSRDASSRATIPASNAQETAPHGGKSEIVIPANIVAELARYDWPGNVRQLRNVARQFIIQNRAAAPLQAAPITLSRLLFAAGDSADKPGDSPVSSRETPAVYAQPNQEWRKPNTVDKAELVAALQHCRWDLKATAAHLQVSRTSLYNLIETMGVASRASDLAAADILRCEAECEGDIDRMVERLGVSKHALRRRVRELKLTLSLTQTKQRRSS